MELYEAISENFNSGALEELCFKLNVDYEDLRGSTRKLKALSLQEYMRTRSQSNKLLVTLKDENGTIQLEPYLYLIIQEMYPSEAQLAQLFQSLGLQIRDFGEPERLSWGSLEWRKDKAQKLQAYMEENGRLPELLTLLQQKGADLSFFKTVPVPVPQEENQHNSIPSYDNYDIRLTSQNGKYTADVLYSPRGQKKGDEQELNLDSVETMLAFLRSKGKARREDVEKLGQLLREALLPGQILGHMEHSLTEAESAGHEGLRVRLRFGLDQPDLLKLPWEYCHDSKGFLALNNKTPFVRFLETDQPDYRPLAVPRPVRVLVALSSPTDYPKLKVDEEAGWIKSALQELEQKGLVTVKVVEHTTSLDLFRQIHLEFKPHIFHFIGHGDFDEDGQGSLALEDGRSEAKAQLFSTKDMLELLRNSSVKLAILSACLTAAFENDDALMGIAPRLVDGGLPAVIAMQFPVPDNAAIAFSQFLYASLAAGEPLDVAITNARKGVYFSGTDRVFWGIPVVFMRTPDGVIWQPPS